MKSKKATSKSRRSHEPPSLEIAIVDRNGRALITVEALGSAVALDAAREALTKAVLDSKREIERAVRGAGSKDAPAQRRLRRD
jgi:hypothetical protein